MKKLIIFLILLSVHYSYAQLDSTLFSSYDSSHNNYIFQPHINFTNARLASNTNLFGLGNGNSLILYRADSDKMVNGMDYRYNQYYNGVKVEFTQFYIHTDQNGNCTSANGELYRNININTTPTISDADAIRYALAFAKDSVYAWQDTARENNLKRDTGNPDSSFYPQPSLVVINLSEANTLPAQFGLAYSVKIYSIYPADAFILYIDASSGNVIYKEELQESIRPLKRDNSFGNNNQSVLNSPSLFCHPAGCQSGSITTLYYGGQTDYTDKITWCAGFCCTYRLKDVCTGTFLYVRQYVGGGDFRDGGNNFNDNSYDESGATALFCLRNTEDYYESTFGRHSYDGSYSQVNLYVDDPSDPNINTDGLKGNAFWNGSTLNIGTSGNGFNNYLTTQDVISHEFTHAVTQYSSGLHGGSGSGESGALNESFSDIFGTMIEFYAENRFSMGHSPDWLLGEEVYSGGSPNNLRDMADPHSSGSGAQPNTYKGVYWDFINQEVHHNNGPQNYWFYLLAHGGSGTNDLGNSYCVEGIGNTEATNIAYRTLTHYLFPSAAYADSRYYSIQAAADLYGPNSNEVAQVTQAWYAVGVGSKFNGIIAYNNLTVPNPQTVTIAHDAEVDFSNLQVNAGGSLIASSNTLIEVYPKSDIESGGTVHSDLFIGPTCGGNAARYASNQGNGNSGNKDSSEKSNLSSPSISDGTDNIVIFPNPSSGKFNLQINNSPSDSSAGNLYRIIVFNLVGEIVYQSNINKNNYVIDLSNQSKGMYFIKVENTKESSVKKVVIQ